MANKKNLYIMAEIKNIAEKTGKSVIEVIDAYIKKNGSNKYLENMKELYVQKEKTEIWDKIQTDIENAIADGEQGAEVEIIEKLMIDIREGNTDYGLDDKGRNEILKKMQFRINNIKSKEQKEAERKAAEEQAKKEEEARTEQARKEEEARAEQARKEEEARAEQARKEEEARAEQARKEEEARVEQARKEEEARAEQAKKEAEEQAKKAKPQISEKTKRAIEEIEKIAERELAEGNIQSKAKYLRSVRNMITGEYEQAVFKVNVDGSERDELLEVLEGKIKDESYFEQVQSLTNDFQYLKENTDIYQGTHGTRASKKISLENMSRFISLRERLGKGDEYITIKSLLKNGEIGEVEARILRARKKVMEREYKMKKDRGDVR